MHIDQLLALLDGVKPTRRGWIARCPAHLDKSPSLSVCEGDKGILIHCFALCPHEAICAAVGRTAKDLFYDSPDADPRAWREQKRKRQAEQIKTEAVRFVVEKQIDLAREAELLIRSAKDIHDSHAWDASDGMRR